MYIACDSERQARPHGIVLVSSFSKDVVALGGETLSLRVRRGGLCLFAVGSVVEGFEISALDGVDVDLARERVVRVLGVVFSRLSGTGLFRDLVLLRLGALIFSVAGSDGTGVELISVGGMLFLALLRRGGSMVVISLDAASEMRDCGGCSAGFCFLDADKKSSMLLEFIGLSSSTLDGVVLGWSWISSDLSLRDSGEPC